MLSIERWTRRAAVLASGVLVVAAGAVGAAPAGAATRYCQGQLVTIEATASDTTVTGTEGPDVIDGVGRVRLTINGLGGDDVICTGPGHQIVVHGGEGDDSLESEIVGGLGGPTQLYGEAGDDTLRLAGDPSAGGYAVDNSKAYGGEGDDQLISEVEYADLTPGPGDDTIVGSEHTQLHFGGTAGVRIEVAAGTADGEGHDTFTRIWQFTGSPGPDTFIGSDGADHFGRGDAPGSALNTDVATGGGGRDSLVVARGTVDGGDGNDSVGVVDGGTASGGAGNDHVGVGVSGTARGGPGNDHLSVQWQKKEARGAVRLFGDGGADRFEVQFMGTDWATPCADPGTCRTVLDGGTGQDAVAFTTYRFGMVVDLHAGRIRHEDARGKIRGIEDVSGTRFADRLLGDDRANVLRGHDGADVLVGRGGSDQLIGGSGKDRAVGGPGRDRCVAERKSSC
ncbi:calcium-binding protein [Nocardioides conyzicola]|uniref:Calcium-binding protein n=1 Tax=Nocardioides conyzicola TaxID=1651781 RepID=A0ABP8WNM3_9ACTN